MTCVGEPTILVVDDEEAIAEAVRARLESEGYRVVTAPDGPRALERFAETHPALVHRYRELYGRGSYAPKAFQKEISDRVHELARRYRVGQASPGDARRVRGRGYGHPDVRSGATGAESPPPPEQLLLL